MRKLLWTVAALAALTVWSAGISVATGVVLYGAKLQVADTITGDADTDNRTISVTDIGAGSTTSPVGGHFNLINVAHDDVAVSAAGGGISAFHVQETLDGADARGGRSAVSGQLVINRATSPLNQNRNYVGGGFMAIANAPDNGTAGNEAGAIFGIAPWAWARSGATNLLNVTGGEVNVTVESGASTKYKSGLQIVDHTFDRVSGSTADAALIISNQPLGVGFRNGILFSPMSGANPVQSSGVLIGTAGHGTVRVGVDLSYYTVTGNLIQGAPGGSALSNVDLWIAGNRVLRGQQPAISDPSGGSKIDVQCRAAVSSILRTLRASTGHGLIAG